MATTDELTQQVNALTAIVNQLINNSKKVSELTLKSTAELTDELPINGSQKLTLSKVNDLISSSINDLISNKEDVLKSLTQITSAYTVLSTDSTIECTSGSFTVTLPTAIGITGRIYNIVNNGNGIITLDGNGGETIMGLLTQSINIGDSMTVQSNNSNWIII